MGEALAAEDSLAEIWQATNDSDAIARAANETEELLRANLSSKGVPNALAKLSEEQTKTPLQRTRVLPERLRSLTCGPLTVYFTPLPQQEIVPSTAPDARSKHISIPIQRSHTAK